MIDQVIWLISNAAGTSDLIRSKILSQVYTIECLVRIIMEAIHHNAMIKQTFLGNVLWCAGNLSRVKRNSNGIADCQLTTEELTKIIFVVETLI